MFESRKHPKEKANSIKQKELEPLIVDIPSTIERVV